MSVYRDKVAIITGGASGIGAAVGRALAKRGAAVVLADINGDGAEKMAASIRQGGGRAQSSRLDVTDAAAVADLVKRTRDEHGRIDLMFNNAGVGLAAELRHTTLSHWNRILDIDLRGVIHGVHAVYPIMIEQGHGHIVNTASINGLAPLPLAGAYNAAKHGVVGLTMTLRAESAGLGVRASAVCPGFIDTPMVDNNTYVELDKKAGQKALPFRLHPVEKCADAILKGVARNRGLIVVTPQAQLLWWLHRLSPGLFSWISGLAAQKTRQLRAEGRL
jgi:NAD(P)-dependent dehydrogenase (short-subunit alcohol dehydrogenase family)